MMQRRWAVLWSIVAGVIAATSAVAAPGQDNGNGAPAPVETAGYPAEQFRVVLAWSEAAPLADAMVEGYRLEPVAGGPAFDVYLDAHGRPLDDAGLEDLGIAPKRWRLEGVSAAFQRRDGVLKAPEAPLPAAVRHGLRPDAEWAWPPLDPREIDKARSDAALEKGPHLVGVVRDADEPITMARGAPSLGRWRSLPGGRAGWALQVHDPGAVGIRLHLSGISLPEDARVLVYDAYDPHARHEVSTREPERWAPTIFSDSAVLEVVVDAAETRAVSFEVTASGHVFEDFGQTAGTKDNAGACNLDVTCYEEFEDAAAAVALYTFVKGSSVFSCTGALMADTDPSSQVPYFMTANHCVGDQSTASTMELFWFYQTAVCDGTPPSDESVPRSSEGAELLSTSTLSEGTDHTLARIHGELPEGVAFLGWDGQPAPFGLDTVGIHHPRGSFKRIAFGPVTDCTAQSSYPCPSRVDLDRFYEVTWEPGGGVTEPGSSGSPIIDAENKAFLGALWGGYAACGASVMADYYGKVEVTLPMVAEWLDPNPAEIRITTNNGDDFSTNDPELTLIGTVSSSATRIEVNGSTDGVSHTVGQSDWSFTTTLEEGPNDFDVIAFTSGVPPSTLITVTLDTNPPVITLNGPNPDFVALGGEYDDPGATAVDPEEGEVEVTVSGTVANEPIGEESILEYSASDSAGNEVTVTRTVIVSPGPDEPPILEITTDGGNGPGEDYATTEPALLLEGFASHNTVSVTVNGSSDGVSFEAGEVDWSFEGDLEEGPNELTVVAASSGGQETSVSITITLDTTPPVITLNGDNPDTVFVGETYDDPGATAEDARDGEVEVTVTGTVVSEPEGTESTLTYRAEDSLGNAAEVTRTVVAVVNPDEAPVVSIITNNGNDFTVPETAVVITGTTTSNTTAFRVNGGTAGVNYTPGDITWSFNAALDEGPNEFVFTADSDAGTSAPLSMVVTRDTTPPVITLNGDNPDTVELGATYVDPGATAEDAIDGPVPVTVTGFVVNSPLGAESTLTYRAVDSVGNEATKTRTVVVEPAFSQPPDVTITTNGGDDFPTNQATVTLEGSVTSNATEVRVNGDTQGVDFEPLDPEWSFQVTLTEGPNAFEVQSIGPGGESPVRTLVVTLDTNPPVITLRGANPMVIPLGGPFNEPGADAFDPEDGAVAVTASGPVATQPLGAESTRVYRAQDSAGNVTEVTRTVIVGELEDLARIRLGSGVAPRTGLLSIPIVLEPGEETLASLDITVQYDSSALIFRRFEAGPAAQFTGASVQATSLGGGRVRLRVIADDEQNGGALLPGVAGRLVLGRGAADLPTSTPLTAAQASGASVEGKALTVQVDGGVAHYIDGTLGPDSDGDGLSDAAEALLGTDPQKFDTNGNGYSDGFEVLHGSDPLDPDTVPVTLPVTGDLNIDGVVNSVDVQLVINGALGLQTPMPTDVNGSGRTNATDVQLVINAALGIMK